MREVVGLTADDWLAVATFAGPVLGAAVAALLAVYLGLRQYARQQEMASVRSWYLEGGVRKLRVAMSGFLSVHLQNYQTACFILATFRDNPKGSPLAPRPDDIPRLYDLSGHVMPIDTFAAAQDLLRDQVVGKWATHALSDITLAGKEYIRQVELPLRAYYDPQRAVTLSGEPEEAYRKLDDVIETWQERVERHFRFVDFLSSIEKVFLASGPTTHRDALALQEDARMTKIRDEMRSEYSKHFPDL